MSQLLLPDDSFRQAELVCARRLVERGWTTALIDRFLGEPTARVDNPHHRNARPMRLWRLQDALVAEQHPDFGPAQAHAARRRSAARALALRTVDRVKDVAWALPVHAPVIDAGSLQAKARNRLVQAHSQRPLLDLRDYEDNAALAILLEQAEPQFWPLDSLFGHPGVRQARSIVRRRLLAAIAAAYPTLADLCRQRMVGVDGAP